MTRVKLVGMSFVFLWFGVGWIPHFVATGTEMRIVPPYIPWPRAAVLLSGACELLGALGILYRPTRRAALWGLFALTIAITPCHIYMLQHPELFHVPYWALVVRLPVQAALLALIAWCAGGFLRAAVVGCAAALSFGFYPPVAGAAVPEKIATVREVYDGTMTSDVQVNTFRHIERLFPSRVVEHGSHVWRLPKHAQQLGNFKFMSAGKGYDLVDFMALDRVTGLLVLKDGEIAYEDYEMGNDENTRWISMSLVKTMTSSMIGAAIQDGFIKSLDEPVTRYLPQLAGSAYDGVSIRNLLQMASGVKWDETYTDPKSDRRAMLDAQIAQKPGAILALMAKLPRAGTPGSIWNYSTGETYVAGAVLRAAVGKPIAQYLSERIWLPVGMESDAIWWLDSPDGQEIGGGGLSATLRDYGRFGLFLMNDGVAGGKRILPEGWVRDASSSKIVGGKKVDYGYFIWPIDAPTGSTNFGAFEAVGIYGQYIYVNPREHVVAVMWGAQPKPVNKETIANEDFFAGLVMALRGAARAP